MPRGRMAAVEAMLTMAPPSPLSIIAGTACFEARKTLSTLTPHDLLPGFPALLDDAALAADADVVVEDVESAEPFQRGGHHASTPVFMAEIGHVGDCLAALGLDHLHRVLRQVGESVDDQHAGAGAGEHDGRRAPVADTLARRAAAGDDGHPVLQSETLLQHDRSPFAAHETVRGSSRLAETGTAPSAGVGGSAPSSGSNPNVASVAR